MGSIASIGASPLLAKALAGLGIVGAGAVIGSVTTSTDGSQRVHRRYAADYTLRPTSKDAALESIDSRQSFGAFTMLGGAALLGFGLLRPGSAHSWKAVIGGAAVLGASIGRHQRLEQAREEVRSGTLPQQTPAGRAGMERSDRRPMSIAPQLRSGDPLGMQRFANLPTYQEPA